MHVKIYMCICIVSGLMGCVDGGAGVSDSRVLRQASLSSPNLLEVVYTLPEPVIERPRGGEPGNVVVSDELHMTAPSRPDLALMESRILLPAGYELDRLEAVVEGESHVATSWFVSATDDLQRYAIQRREVSQGEGAVRKFAHSLTYLVGVQRRRGANIAVVNIFPLRFDGEEGTLAYMTSLRLRFHLRPVAGDAMALPYRPDPYRSVEAEVDNPEQLASYQAGSAEVAAGRLCGADKSVDYVIITSNELAAYDGDGSLAELIALKSADGLSAEVVTVEQIGEAFPDDEGAVAIRKFLREAYANWQTDFVLLVGDAAIVPTWSFIDTAGGAVEPWLVTDIHYQCLDGEIAGETNAPLDAGADWLAEVYVGRVPVRSAEGMANWVGKLSAYRQVSASQSSQEMLLVGGFLGLGGRADWAKPQMEQIRLGGTWGGVAGRGLAEHQDISIDVLYDQDRVCPMYMGHEIRDQINANDYSLVHYMGHGGRTMAIKMLSEHVVELTNTVPFFAYVCGCRAGNFGQDSVATDLLAGPHGAVGVVAYSAQAVTPADSEVGYSQLLSRYFWDDAVAHWDWPAGVINTSSHERSLWMIWHSAQQIVVVSSNFLGDPAMRLAMPQGQE